jgi:hypothetical protein
MGHHTFIAKDSTRHPGERVGVNLTHTSGLKACITKQYSLVLVREEIKQEFEGLFRS